jgi:hypothetical protein
MITTTSMMSRDVLSERVICGGGCWSMGWLDGEEIV